MSGKKRLTVEEGRSPPGDARSENARLHHIWVIIIMIKGFICLSLTCLIKTAVTFYGKEAEQTVIKYLREILLTCTLSWQICAFCTFGWKDPVLFTILNRNEEPRSLIWMMTAYVLILKRKGSCDTHTRHVMQLSPTPWPPSCSLLPGYRRDAFEFRTWAKKMAFNVDELAKDFRPGRQKVSNSDISKE